MSGLQKSKTASLAKPDDLLQVGRELKSFIEKNKLSTPIAGKSYAHVDAWKFAGACFGLTAIVGKPVVKHNGQEMRIAFSYQSFRKKDGTTYQKEVVIYYGHTNDSEGYKIATEGKKINRELVKPFYSYECYVEIIKISTGKVVGTGTGLCSNLEASKAVFDEYSIHSMSQTRAVGKGYRNLLGYIMNEAGHESTPAEEMGEDHIKESAEANQSKTKGPPKMTKDQANRVLMSISSGVVTDLDMIKKDFTISEDQESSFEELIKAKKSD